LAGHGRPSLLGLSPARDGAPAALGWRTTRPGMGMLVVRRADCPRPSRSWHADT